MSDWAARGRSRRGAASAAFVLVGVLIGVPACASPADVPDSVASDPEPVAAPPTVAPTAPVRADAARVAVVRGLIRDALPRRIWWRCVPQRSDVQSLLERPPLKPEDVFMSDRPGGERLPGTWDPFYGCGEARTPISFWSREVLDAAIAAAEKPTRNTWFGDYKYTWISTERNGQRWWLYTRPRSPPDPAFSEEERRLVGRWHHIVDGRGLELELLEGGSGRGSDGSLWTWISAEDGLELRVQEDHPKYGSIWVTTAMRLSGDRRSYRGIHDEKTTGTRIDDIAKPR